MHLSLGGGRAGRSGRRSVRRRTSPPPPPRLCDHETDRTSRERTGMRALVLHEKNRMSIEEVEAPGAPGPGQVRIAMHTVGICASDVHYWTDGKIGPFVVEAPMILGHEGAGTVLEVGEGVTDLAVGDRVVMEPGVPDPTS